MIAEGGFAAVSQDRRMLADLRVGIPHDVSLNTVTDCTAKVSNSSATVTAVNNSARDDLRLL
jgi:hypothetical protein